MTFVEIHQAIDFIVCEHVRRCLLGSASATIELARTAGAWQQVPALRDVALDQGHPLYFPGYPASPGGQLSFVTMAGTLLMEATPDPFAPPST